MTKRAGRRKNRMGKGPIKPPASAHAPQRDPTDTITEDNLPPAQGLAIELAATREGWLLSGLIGNKLRQALLNKITSIALKSTNDITVIRAFQALVMAEQRELLLAKQKAGRSIDDLPEQVAVVDQPVSSIEHSEPWKVIQDLLGNQAVIDAIVTNTRPAGE